MSFNTCNKFAESGAARRIFNFSSGPKAVIELHEICLLDVEIWVLMAFIKIIKLLDDIIY